MDYPPERPKFYWARIALVIIGALVMLALCNRMTPEGERDHFRGVTNVFK